MTFLVRDKFDKLYNGETEYQYSVPDTEDEALQYAVLRLQSDMADVNRAETTDDLITRVANLKEVIELIDIMSERQVSIRQVNLKKQYGSYTELLLAEEVEK
jgi:hypothetical protein